MLCGLFVSSSSPGAFRPSLPKFLVKGGGNPVRAGSVPLLGPEYAAFSFVLFSSVFSAEIICCLFMRQCAGRHRSLVHLSLPPIVCGYRDPMFPAPFTYPLPTLPARWLHSIRWLPCPSLARRKAGQTDAKINRQMFRDSCERNAVEGRNGNAKRRFGLDRLFSKLDETAKTEAALILLAMNACHWLARWLVRFCQNLFSFFVWHAFSADPKMICRLFMRQFASQHSGLPNREFLTIMRNIWETEHF